MLRCLWNGSLDEAGLQASEFLLNHFVPRILSSGEIRAELYLKHACFKVTCELPDNISR